MSSKMKTESSGQLDHLDGHAKSQNCSDMLDLLANCLKMVRSGIKVS